MPAYRLVNTRRPRYRIEKRILADPTRPALLQETSFTPLQGAAADYRVYVLLAPHLVNAGMGNTAWVGEHKGKPMLFASGRGICLALASSLPWGDCSAGYVGFSDGWQQLSRDGRLDPACQRAEDGNVALTGEIGFSARQHKALLALGFGATPEEAAENAAASLKRGFRAGGKDLCRRNGAKWQAGLLPLDRHDASGLNTYRVSTAVLATHLSLARPGAAVASLSIPWGASKGDDDLGGYHLVWPRDLVETAGGFLAAGDRRRRRCRSSPISARSSSRTAIGRKTSGSTARPIGRASRWTNAPSRCCWPMRCTAPAICRAPSSPPSCR